MSYRSSPDTGTVDRHRSTDTALLNPALINQDGSLRSPQLRSVSSLASLAAGRSSLHALENLMKRRSFRCRYECLSLPRPYRAVVIAHPQISLIRQPDTTRGEPRSSDQRLATNLGGPRRSLVGDGRAMAACPTRKGTNGTVEIAFGSKAARLDQMAIPLERDGHTVLRGVLVSWAV
jgi:hypothetical protein